MACYVGAIIISTLMYLCN